MANAQEIPVEENPSILIFGDSGTHKTFFLANMPGIHVFDFDKGMAIVRGQDVEYTTFKDAPRFGKAMPESGIHEWGTGWPKFIDYLNKIGVRIDKGERIPIGVDSLTTMSKVCMNYVLKGTGHTGSPQIQHWGAQMDLMETVMDQLTAWPVPLIVTAHVQRNTNDLTETVEMLPLLTGKFAGKVGIFFDEVYYATVKGKGAEKKWILQTESYGLVKQAKTRYGVTDGIETEWKNVAPFFKPLVAK